MFANLIFSRTNRPYTISIYITSSVRAGSHYRFNRNCTVNILASTDYFICVISKSHHTNRCFSAFVFLDNNGLLHRAKCIHCIGSSLVNTSLHCWSGCGLSIAAPITDGLCSLHYSDVCSVEEEKEVSI